MNRGVTAAAVWAVLDREFGADVARSAIVSFLSKQGEREVASRRSDVDDMFLVNCCFALCKAVAAAALDAPTTKVLLWTLPPVGYHREMKVWAKRHFDQAGLLLCLAEGLRSASSDMMRACCVNGVERYFYEVDASPDDAACRALVVFETELRAVVPTADGILRETVDGALKVIWKFREEHSCCGRPDTERRIAWSSTGSRS